jgi:diaminopimelate epimerase
MDHQCLFCAWRLPPTQAKSQYGMCKRCIFCFDNRVHTSMTSHTAQAWPDPHPDAFPFQKMHGLGNDFVVLDARHSSMALTQPLLARIADRRFGIGCDQVIVLETAAHADIRMRIFNPDGSEVGACGNATRCIGALMMAETGKAMVEIETMAGLLTAARDGAAIAVDMGLPRLGWEEIPLAGAGGDTLRVPIDVSGIEPSLPQWFSAVNMGNPHAIFVVEDVERFDLPRFGPILEVHPLFPEKANISLIAITGQNRIMQRVWERGAGITLACGTGACAGAVAAWRLGLCDGAITTTLPGGSLTLKQEANGHVRMIGAVEAVFSGVLAPSWLAGAA